MLLIPLSSHSGRPAEISAREKQNKPILSFAELPEFTILPGKILYDRYCAFCHGNTGKGDGLNAFSMRKRPANLQNILRDLSVETVEKVIFSGGPAVKLSGQMPAFGSTLSAGQLTKLQKYLRQQIQTAPGRQMKQTTGMP